MKIDMKKISVFSVVSGVLFLLLGFVSLIGMILDIAKYGFDSLSFAGIFGMLLYGLAGIALVVGSMFQTKLFTSGAFAVLGLFTLLTTFFGNLSEIGDILEQIFDGYFNFASVILLVFGILMDLLSVLSYLLAAVIVFGKDSGKLAKFEGMMSKLFWLPAVLPIVNFLLGIVNKFVLMIGYKRGISVLFNGMFTSFFNAILVAAAIFCGVAALYLKNKKDPLIVEPQE